ncbi:MAG: hypothetical protein HKN49_09470 [Gammaproteobacteria bacterium]|nr:hypothetical protein [Gammaproteobacteria bacterium]
MDEIVCFSCGASQPEIILPVRRLEVCRQCNSELHVCRMCEFYDTTVANACREPIADEVKDKEHANFCDYFRVKPDAYEPPDKSASDAEQQLNALFGDTPQQAGQDDLDRLNSLFGDDDD